MFQTPLLSQFTGILQSGSVLAAQQWLVERLGPEVTQADVEEMGNLVASRNMARDPQTRSILDSLIAEKAGVDLAKLTAPSAVQTVPTFLLFQNEPPQELQAGVFLAAPSFEAPRFQSAAETPEAPAAAAASPQALPTPEEIIPILSSMDIWQRRDAALRGSLILEHLETGVRRTIASILGEALVRYTGRELLEAAKRFAFYEELGTLMESIFGSGEVLERSQKLIEELLEYLFQQRQGDDQTLLLQVLIGKLPTAHPSLKPLLIRILAPRVEDLFFAFRPYLAEKYPGTVRRAAAVCLAQALPRLEKIPFNLVLEIFGAADFEHGGEEARQILSSLGTIIPKLGEEEKMELARWAAKHPAPSAFTTSSFISGIGPHVYRSHLPEIVELALTAILNQRPPREDIARALTPLDAKERLKVARKLKKQYLREKAGSAEIIFYLKTIEGLLSEFSETTPASFEKSSGEKTLAPFAESARELLKHPDTEVREASLDFLKGIFPRLEAEDKIRTVEALEQIPANDFPAKVCWAFAAALPHLEEAQLKERSLSLGKRILDAAHAGHSWSNESLASLLHSIAETFLKKFKEPESLRELHQFFQSRLFDDPEGLNAVAAVCVVTLSTYFGPEERMAQMFFLGGLLSVRGGSHIVRGSIFRAFEIEREKFNPSERRLMALLALPEAPHQVRNFLTEEEEPHFAYLLAAQVGQGKIERGLMVNRLHILRGMIESVKDSGQVLRMSLELLPALAHEDEEVRETAQRCLEEAAGRLEKPALETLGLKVAGLLKEAPVQHRREAREILFHIYSSLEDSAQRTRLLLSLEEMLWEEDEAEQSYGEELFHGLLGRSKLSPEKLWEVAWNVKPRLQNPQPHNRRAAAAVLGKVGELSGSEEILSMMMGVLINDAEKRVRDEAKKSIYGIFGSIPSEDQPSVAQKMRQQIHDFRFAREEEKILDAVEALKVLAMKSRGEVRFVFLDYMIGLMSSVRESNDPFIRRAVVEALSSREFQVSLNNEKGYYMGHEEEMAIKKFLHQLEGQLAHHDAGVRLAMATVMTATIEYYLGAFGYSLYEPHLRTLAGMLLGDDSEEVRTTLIGFFEKMKAARGEEVQRFAEKVVAAFAPPAQSPAEES